MNWRTGWSNKNGHGWGVDPIFAIKLIIMQVMFFSSQVIGQNIIDYGPKFELEAELQRIGECGLKLRIAEHVAVYDENDSITGTTSVVAITEKRILELYSKYELSALNDALLELFTQEEYSWNCCLLLFNINPVDASSLRGMSCKDWSKEDSLHYYQFWTEKLE